MNLERLIARETVIVSAAGATTERQRSYRVRRYQALRCIRREILAPKVANFLLESLVICPATIDFLAKIAHLGIALAKLRFNQR